MSRIPSTGATLSLTHFIRRREVLALYRSALRVTRRVEDKTSRAELAAYARRSLESVRHVQDVHQISYLLTDGKRELEQFEQLLNMSK